jgi:hypothetical protein
LTGRPSSETKRIYNAIGNFRLKLFPNLIISKPFLKKRFFNLEDAASCNKIETLQLQCATAVYSQKKRCQMPLIMQL